MKTSSLRNWLQDHLSEIIGEKRVQNRAGKSPSIQTEHMKGPRLSPRRQKQPISFNYPHFPSPKLDEDCHLIGLSTFRKLDPTLYLLNYLPSPSIQQRKSVLRAVRFLRRLGHHEGSKNPRRKLRPEKCLILTSQSPGLCLYNSRLRWIYEAQIKSHFIFPQSIFQNKKTNSTFNITCMDRIVINPHTFLCASYAATRKL